MKRHRASSPRSVELEAREMGPGQGPVVLFLHGLGADLGQFLAQQSALARTVRTIACSQRGHGGSEAPKPPHAGAYRLELLAADVVALLRDRDVPQAHLVGNGLGALVALEIGRQAPRVVSSLMLSGALALQHWSATRQALQRAALWLGGADAGVAFAVGHPRAQGIEEREAERLTEMMARAAPGAIERILQHLGHYDYRDVLQRLDAPILLVRAGRDMEVSPRLGDTLDALFAGAQQHGFLRRVMDLPRAGHWCNLQTPAAYNRILREWLGELGIHPPEPLHVADSRAGRVSATARAELGWSFQEP